jgi:hypothetical protein
MVLNYCFVKINSIFQLSIDPYASYLCQYFSILMPPMNTVLLKAILLLAKISGPLLLLRATKSQLKINEIII